MFYSKLITGICLSFVTFVGSVLGGVSAEKWSEVYGNPSDAEEVFLTFKYRGTGTVVIAAMYHEGQFYLPVTELFETLMIPFETDLSRLTISGDYLSQDLPYELHFDDKNTPRGRVGDSQVPFGADDFIVGELDFYLLPEHFSELFGLNFQIDFNNLTLSLETDHQLPVELRMERERRRQQISEQNIGYNYYPLEYGRRHKMLGGAFVDYSLNSQVSEGRNQYNYNLDVGSEILGGDLEGTLLGAYNTVSGFTNTSRNLRWRFVPGNRNIVSGISVGQINSRGLLNNTYRGIRVTNEPIEPHVLFQDYVVDGTTTPQSEVEIYLNNSLVDFQEADENGYYRFQIPLTYGTSRMQVVIFRPDGSREERNERVQIPYTFLRKGNFQYDIYAGQAQSSLFTGTDEFWQTQISGAYGLTPWLTTKAGIEYYEPDPAFQPLPYGSVSARIASKYLLNIDVAPNVFYRANANVIFPSSVSMNASYTLYDEQRSIFNVLGTKQELNGNIYLPFRLGSVPLSLRISANHQLGEFSQNTRYRADFSSRFGRLNLRFGYLDRQVGPLNLVISPSSVLTSTATYIFSRAPSVPQAFKGLYLRSQLDYKPSNNQLEQIDFQLSRSVFRDGRIQLSAGKNFNGNFTFARLNFTLDFNKVRLTTTARNTRNNTSVTQNIRGSMGFDHNYSSFFLTNRQQVGRSAASVRLFVDDDNSGTYNEGEQVLQYNAARLNRSAARSEMDEEGIIRLTQLQSYYRHNFEINHAAIKNPIIVPKINEFSFISDPNQFKQIDVPFYITGIIEGMVHREHDSNNRRPISGARMYLVSTDGSFTKELRTFSDGSFYAYEIPPNDYNLYVDPSQLEYLNSYSDPDTLSFTVRATSEGDYISGLEFTIKDSEFREEDGIIAAAGTDAEITDVTTPFDTYAEYSHRVQIGSYKNRRNADKVKAVAEHQFGIPFVITYNIKRGLYAVRTLPIQNRSQALDLLFSISNSQFDESVLVLMDDRDSEQTRKNKNNKIQIGAFATQPLAIRHARLSSIKLDMPTIIRYDTLSSLYNVHINQLDEYQSSEQQLKTIKQRDFFSDAFIKNVPLPEPALPRSEDLDFVYQIHVEGVSKISEQAYLSQVTDNTDIPDLDINKGPEEELIVFQKLTDWEDTLELKQKLDMISGMGRPFVVLIEKQD